MNKIDIDVIYGIKPRKYQDGGPVGDNTTPMYSGEGWHASQLIPNFRAPYLQYFINPNDPTKTYVLWSAARDANIPFVADTATSEPGAFFDYSPDTRFGGEIVNPNTTYVAIDPEGRIINTDAASIILDGKDMIPVNDSWAYHPQLGWYQPTSNGGSIVNPDTEMARNFLGNTLGWEQAYRLPPEVIANMSDATADAMMQGAAGVVGGEVLGAAAKYAPKAMQFVTKAPRTTAMLGQLGIGAGVGYAMNKNEINEYLSNIDGDITDADFERMGGEKALPDMLLWLSEHGYNFYNYNDQNQPIEIKRSFYFHPNERYIFGPKGAFYYEDIPFGLAGLAALASKKKGLPWLIAGGYALGKGLRIAYNNSPTAQAGKLVNYLLAKGYVKMQDNSSPYNVTTDQNNNPQVVDGNTTVPQMQDSAASAIPYNEYQGEVYDQNGEQVNPDYVGFETDTASNQ